MRSDYSNESRRKEQDYYTLLKYRAFREGADYVARALATVPTVARIALIGSVASPPRVETAIRGRRGFLHDPKDVDLAVWLDGPPDLNRIRILLGKAVTQLFLEKELGVAHHQVDVFLLDPTNTYLGTLCHFGQCPKGKPECRVEGCGRVPFLRQHEEFVFDVARSLAPGRIQVLYERPARA
jgi:hypothetical protein